MCNEGPNLCCLAVNEEGEYSVKVQCGNQEQTSAAVQIVKCYILSVVSTAGAKERRKSASGNEEDKVVLLRKPSADTVSYGVPFIDRQDLQYDPKLDEIGRGTFGAVYKASWAGTAIAVKQMKVRQMKMMKSVIQSEIHVHSKIRHPNIVQIMAVAMGKSAVYIVSELVDGSNLDELLFSSDEDDTRAFTITDDKKPFMGQQITQAVAYLHNLKPPILHRDIKPANVLVAIGSYITKLCDMGLMFRLRALQVHRITCLPNAFSKR